jgi:23S rRNA-/tRNA-specific pseudouridylate synthase
MMVGATSEVQSILRTEAITPPDGPPRSPDAERFDPPVWKLRFVPERELSWDALLQEACARLGDLAPALARVLWHGGIHVAGRPIDGDAPPRSVAAGEWIALYGFVREPEPIALDPHCILWDAEGLVAVDKPVWLSMQRTRASVRSSLEDQLRALLGAPDLQAVHRLDRQTSGVALFARDRMRAAELGRAFHDRRVHKRYTACVSPAPAEERFVVSGWLGRVMHPARFRFGVFAEPGPERRESHTRFRVLKRCARGARVEALPATGRTHQLRVHLGAHGTPIAGDDLYGPPWREGAAGAAPRVLLHAAELGLERAGRPLRIEAPEPADLRAFSAQAG